MGSDSTKDKERGWRKEREETSFSGGLEVEGSPTTPASVDPQDSDHVSASVSLKAPQARFMGHTAQSALTK